MSQYVQKENLQLKANITGLRKTVLGQQKQLTDITKELHELQKQITPSSHASSQQPQQSATVPAATQAVASAKSCDSEQAMRNLIKEPLVELLGPLGIGPEGHRKQSPTPKKKNTHILSSSDGEISATSKKLNSAKNSACNSRREQKMFSWNCHCSYCWENVCTKEMDARLLRYDDFYIYKKN